MSLTNWDEVLPAFDRAFEEINKRIGNSKEATLEFLKEAGILELLEEQEQEEAEKAEDAESNLKQFLCH